MFKINKLSFGEWLQSVRAFSFAASVMPVIFGTAIAAVKGGADINIFLFALALTGMLLLHSGANLLNDFFDHRKGLDREASPASGGILKGLLEPRESLFWASVFLAAGSAVGLLIVFFTSIEILYLGTAGVAVGILYSLDGFWGLKYKGLGDAAVFLDFGVFGTLGAWMIQTGTFSWLPVVWSVPISLLVIAILHANNWRDIEGDGKENIVTVAMLLGQKGSLAYYGFLLLSPFAFILLFMAAPVFAGIQEIAMPVSFLVVFLALPAAFKLIEKARSREENMADFAALDGITAKFNTLFGLLSVAAVLAGPFVKFL